MLTSRLSNKCSGCAPSGRLRCPIAAAPWCRINGSANAPFFRSSALVLLRTDCRDRRVSAACPRVSASVEAANPGELVGSAALERTNEKVPVALPPELRSGECARVELEDAARLRAEAYYEDSSGRYVETFKRHFVRQETDSLRTRTAVSPNGFPECVCLVAVWEGSGQVVGTLDIRPPAGSVGSTRLHRDGRYLNGVPVGVPKGSYVLNVCVSEERRGSGIGTALMREACKEARRRWGAQEMFTEVDTWNDSAYSLYSRVGFQRYSPDGTPSQPLLLARGPATCSTSRSRKSQPLKERPQP